MGFITTHAFIRTVHTLTPKHSLVSGLAWDRVTENQTESSVSANLPIRPDLMPLREVLRGLRFMLRRGGETLAETIAMETLPKPAADLAGAVMREVGGLARNVDQVASGLAKSVLSGKEPHSVTLNDLSATPDEGARFAAAMYVALGAVLRRLGAPGVFVSEAAAKNAYGSNTLRSDSATTSIFAAHLTLDLLDARVMRGATADEAARVAGSALEPVATFAVLLWLQSSRSDEDNEAALDAASDLAVAVAADVARVCSSRDIGQIAALYAKLVAHV